MKKLFNLAVLALIASAPIYTSCTDDEEIKIKKPSREIVQVDIYKADNVNHSFYREALYNISYDSKNRISNIRSEYNSQEVSYRYDSQHFAYTWDGSYPETGVFSYSFEAELRNGRVQVGSLSKTDGTDIVGANYSYHYNSNGMLQDATYGGAQTFNYEWGKSTLIIKGNPTTYNTKYSYSKVENNYSIDINVLPQLVDERIDIMVAMNTYAQLGGALGNKYPYILENNDYKYQYLFDHNNRIVQMVQTPDNTDPNKQATYWFMIHYGD